MANPDGRGVGGLRLRAGSGLAVLAASALLAALLALPAAAQEPSATSDASATPEATPTPSTTPGVSPTPWEWPLPWPPPAYLRTPTPTPAATPEPTAQPTAEPTPQPTPEPTPVPIIVPATDDPLCEQLAAEVESHEELTVGLVLVDLASGERCGYRPDEQMHSASLYKLVVLAEAHRQQALGAFSFNEPLVLLPEHSIDNLPDQRLTEPMETTAAEAARLMIQISDNTSAVGLSDRLGFDLVDAAPEWLRMPSTVLEPQYVTTATDIADYFEMLYRGDIVSAEASEAMLALLEGQRLRDLIPYPLPDGTTVAAKNGTLADTLNDAAIVQAPAGDYVLVVLTQHPYDYSAAEHAIRRISALVYDAYSGADPGAERAADRPGLNAEAPAAPRTDLGLDTPVGAPTEAAAAALAAAQAEEEAVSPEATAAEVTTDARATPTEQPVLAAALPRNSEVVLAPSAGARSPLERFPVTAALSLIGSSLLGLALLLGARTRRIR